MSIQGHTEQELGLIIEHQSIIYKVCHTYCKRVGEREDLTQEIFYHLIKSISSYNPEMKFTTWMYRVALNVAISFYRKKNIETLELQESHAQPYFQNESIDKEAQLLALENFIHQLKEFDRALMMLYLESKSYKEISEIMGLSVTNVSTKINRIKQQLKIQLLNQ